MTAHGATHEVYYMPSTHFNALSYSKKLKAVGVSEAAAEVHAEALAEVIDKNLATKQDLHEVRREIHDTKKELKKEIDDTKKELKKEIEDTKIELKRDIQEMGSKLTIRMGSMAVTAVLILPVIFKIYTYFINI